MGAVWLSRKTNEETMQKHLPTRPVLHPLIILLLTLALLVSGNPAFANEDSEDSSGRRIWLPVMVKSPNNVVPAVPPSGEWTQDAHDAQRTGYTSEMPAQPWTLLWTWNGPDSQGGAGGHFYDAPWEARTVTGGAHVYVPAGRQGLYALDKRTGRQVWNFRDTSFNVTPAYDPATGHVYAGGSDGRLYKIDGSTGRSVGSYQTGEEITKSILLAESHAYVLTASGKLHKVSLGNMGGAWTYNANSSASTPPAYSASKGLIIYATRDLFIHAVRVSSGTASWRVKPTPHPAQFPYTFEGYWPVVAEQSGVVFVRLNLGMESLFSGPLQGKWGGGVYPATNAETRTLLQKDNGKLKNLFALDLDSGMEKFVPAVGYGGVEGLKDGKPILETGPVPVVRRLPNGTEVAYSHFRSAQGDAPDGRWDSHLGEMVLNNNTISGMGPGDLRFINSGNLYVKVTDEQTPLTMAGDTLFHAHWGASESLTILDRSSSKGLSFNNPISTTILPAVIRRQLNCSDFKPSTHWTTCGLTLFDDGRFWTGPGWWVYWNVLDPPTPSRRAYSEGILPRYTYVSDGLIIVQGNGGELFVLKHSGK
jgi:hypothetical protein